jgi:hypothetical protein
MKLNFHFQYYKISASIYQFSYLQSTRWKFIRWVSNLEFWVLEISQYSQNNIWHDNVCLPIMMFWVISNYVTMFFDNVMTIICLQCFFIMISCVTIINCTCFWSCHDNFYVCVYSSWFHNVWNYFIKFVMTMLCVLFIHHILIICEIRQSKFWWEFYVSCVVWYPCYIPQLIFLCLIIL